jgi:hypothetical protein
MTVVTLPVAHASKLGVQYAASIWMVLTAGRTSAAL